MEEQKHPCAPMCAPDYYPASMNGSRKLLVGILSTLLSALIIATFAWAWTLNLKVTQLESQIVSLRIEMLGEARATRSDLTAELKQQRLEWGLLVKALDKRMVQVEEDHNVIRPPRHVP